MARRDKLRQDSTGAGLCYKDSGNDALIALSSDLPIEYSSRGPVESMLNPVGPAEGSSPSPAPVSKILHKLGPSSKMIFITQINAKVCPSYKRCFFPEIHP